MNEGREREGEGNGRAMETENNKMGFTASRGCYMLSSMLAPLSLRAI